MVIPTNWFQSTGVKCGNFNKNTNELLIPIDAELANFLQNIETLAIDKGLKLPSEFQTNLGNDDVFKRLPDRSHLYFKLNSDCACFDKDCKEIKPESMGNGNYRAMIHITSIYIGVMQGGKLAALQMRICQIQNEAKPHTFMFPPSTPALKYKQPLEAFLPSVETPAIAAAAKARGRKPRLQRQNGVIESNNVQLQQGLRTMEALPADFFNDLDLSRLA